MLDHNPVLEWKDVTCLRKTDKMATFREVFSLKGYGDITTLSQDNRKIDKNLIQWYLN